MDTRYQVFVSSTYSDLKDERQKVIQAIMGLDCIPAGMELFPANDAEQFDFIKSIIDDCDYYVLIIGGKYGSLTSEEISFTEREHDYAVEKNIPVCAFLHEEPGAIAVDKSERDQKLVRKLETFKERVKDGRLVSFWNSPDELAGKVLLSLSKTIKSHPATGWVRGDTAVDQTVYRDLSELRKENAGLKQKIDSIESQPEQDEVGHYTFYIHIERKIRNSWKTETVDIPTEELFRFTASELAVGATEYTIKKSLEELAEIGSDHKGTDVILCYPTLDSYFSFLIGNDLAEIIKVEPEMGSPFRELTISTKGKKELARIMATKRDLEFSIKTDSDKL